MDTLSQLLYLSQGQLQLDVFCQMKGHFSLPHVSSVEHETIFHLVLSGQCYVQIEKSAPIVLSEGTFLMLNRRQSHTLWSGERDIEPPLFCIKIMASYLLSTQNLKIRLNMLICFAGE
ncbi:cupin domain-containing protein [Proteus mirabilis]|uniref:cupin domain-containing protein n=1 Tax=Proteus mirabilis TaxID=584 RepID=UPI003D2B2445